ncbi:1,4-alpha-glucan branching enzyme [Bacillus timonensis]|nr:1,4-alpha-glucan branching enzyme [Bacillus timonensis]
MLSIPTDYDIHLFHEGNLFKSHLLFGAHLLDDMNISGTRFCVWAPHAAKVSVVGNFNKWQGTHHKMKKVNNEGIWTLFIPELTEGELYKYEITTAGGRTLIKSDPYAFYSETRPNTASIIYHMDGYRWNDERWQRNKHKKSHYDQPLFIYELHVGSWKKKNGTELLSYQELAKELIPYVLDHGFTHIELLPLVEHPLDKSWGYQGVGYFSPTSRYGTPKDLMEFIDTCHQHNIGVILDWVPGHFCKDAHGLYMFDGEPTYEYKKYQDRENEVWGTANFDLGKPEVQSFLISNALFWMEYFHIDGFRVDAVANMLYWPNQENNLHKNSYAVDFLKKLNEVVFENDPSMLMIAEDSTDWPLVTAPTSQGGIGFNYKWNMGWMNDILSYMEAEPSSRKELHHKVSFSLLYAFSENFILPFSHDEVVHGKKSLLNKMPGDYWSKFAQLRLLLGYLLTHPGKKLLFMGAELAQFSEWKDFSQLDWNLEEYDMHKKSNAYVKELLRVYKKYKALHEVDHDPSGFEWIDVNNNEQSIFSFIRKAKKKNEDLIVVCNFKPNVYEEFKVGVPQLTNYIEEFNSDFEEFGGTDRRNRKRMKAIDEPFHNQRYHISITIPPFGVCIFRPVKKRGERVKHGSKKMCSNVTSRGKRKST